MLFSKRLQLLLVCIVHNPKSKYLSNGVIRLLLL